MEIYRIQEGAAPSQMNGRYAVVVRDRSSLPGVKCPPRPHGCGVTWGMGGHRVYRELPEDHYLRIMDRKTVPLDQFRQIAADVRRTLSLPADIPLFPGTNLGRLTVEMRHQEIVDLSSPELLNFVVTDRFRQFLIDGCFTGWRVENMRVIPRRPDTPMPAIYELVVEGRGGTAITEPARARVSRCPQCGREEWDKLPLNTLELDTDRWDGSHIFRFDPPFQGYTFVTKRLSDAIKDSGLTNIQLRDINDTLETINSFASTRV